MHSNKQECHPITEEIILAEAIIIQIKGGEAGREEEDEDLKMVTDTTIPIFYGMHQVMHNMVAGQKKTVIFTMDQAIVVRIENSMQTQGSLLLLQRREGGKQLKSVRICLPLMCIGGGGLEVKATNNNPRKHLRPDFTNLLLLQRRQVGK